MKHLLNTLYATTQGAYLSRDGETVQVKVGQETRLQLPIHLVGGIVCFGQVTCTAPLMHLCCERGVAITMLSEYGRFWARIEGPVSGNVLLRREQYRRSDDEAGSAAIARMVVTGKTANCRTVLQRALRDHPDIPGAEAVEAAVKRLSRILDSLQVDEMTVDHARALEGEAAMRYFAVFDHLITAQKDSFNFRERSRRPPLDNMNALLSFIYVLLAHDARSALESVGLDPAVGFLHRDRPGRPSLALDLMEEFRPFFADRLVLSLVNRQQVRASGFKRSETGAVMMTEETIKEVLTAYQKRKQEEIQHPFLEEKMATGLLFFVQALLMARHLRGDLDAYPPFLWK